MMKNRSAVKALVSAAFILCGASASQAATDDMPLGRMASPPSGYIEMCQRAPIQCSINPDASPSQLSAIKQWASQAYWIIVFARTQGVRDEANVSWARGATAATQPATDAPVALEPASGKISTTLALPPAAAPEGGGQTRAPIATASWDRIRPPTTAPAAISVPGPTTDASAATFVANDRASPSATTNAETWQPPRFFTDLGMDRLNAINRSINRAIRPTSDLAAFGKVEYWTVPTGPRAAGDCEDYVMAKRQALIEAGAPSEALSIAIVRTARGEMHTVLLVATPDGEVVLDNLSPWIVSWRQTSYHWLQRQARGSALTWVYPGMPS